MAKDCKEKNEILDKVKSGVSPIVVSNTQAALLKIPDGTLKEKETQKTFSKRLVTLRKNSKLSQEDLARKTHLHHATISKLEYNAILLDNNKEKEIKKLSRKPMNVNKYYLELISLALEVSPLYLVGLVDDPSMYNSEGLIDPLIHFEPNRSNATKKIIYNILSQEIKNAKELFYDFTKICEAKALLQDHLKTLFHTIPRIEKSINSIEISNIEPLSEIDSRKVQGMFPNYYDYCLHFDKFYNLTTANSELFKCLYMISCEPELFEVTHQWLILWGYLDNARSFVKNDESKK